MNRMDPDEGHWATGRGRLTWADPVFVVSVLLLGYLRFRILGAGGAPPTIDSGNWLAYGDQLFGGGVRSSTIVYPPVVPLLAKASVGAFGLVGGISLLGSVASTAPAIGIYLTLRWLGMDTRALAPALLVLGASSTGEATAWGGFPQLIGLGLMPVTLVAVDRLTRTWSRRDAFVVGILLAGVLATSHFIGAITVIGAGLVALLGITSRSASRPRGRRGAEALGLVILPLIWLAPLYITLFQAFGNASRSAPFFNELSWGNLIDQVEFLYRDLRWLWRFLLGIALLAVPVFAVKRRTPLWRITTALLGAIVTALALTRESRFLYVLTPYAALGLALWISHGADLGSQITRRLGRSWANRQVAALSVVVLMALAVWQAAAGLDFFESQRDTYAVLNEELVEGIEHVRDATGPGTVLAVTSLNDAPVGWWVEAITQRETFYGAPLRWLLFEDEIRRATVANAVFVPPFPNPNGLQLASQAGIDLILVPTRWVFYDEDEMEALARENPGSVEQINDELVLVRPGALNR